MASFSAIRRPYEDQEVVLLSNPSTGAAATIWPGWGNNCIALVLPAPDGRHVRVIKAPPELERVRQQPSWWGIPLLFPFPGTIPNGEYAFEGQHYRLGQPGQLIVPEGKEQPGARRNYHGFVMDLPWQVADTGADDQSAWVTSTLDSADHPHTQEGFPFPFRVQATYRLDATGLSLHFQAENSGQGRLPFGFGAHPFFRLVLGDEGRATDALICIPAERKWQGRRPAEASQSDVPSWDEVCPPVQPDNDLRQPRPFVEGAFNGMYRELTPVATPHGPAFEAFLRDPAARLETVMHGSPNLPNIVFWSPPDPERAEACFEPWSCPSNVFNQAARGVPNHGLTVLEPGATWDTHMWISLRRAVA